MVSFATPASGRPKQRRSKESKVLYAFHCGPSVSDARRQRYKVGKTVDLDRRIRPYMTIYPQGKVFHKMPCSDIDVAERWLHDVLKLSGFHVEREIFEAPPDVVRETMNAVVAFHEQCRRDGKNASRMRHLARAMG